MNIAIVRLPSCSCGHPGPWNVELNQPLRRQTTLHMVCGICGRPAFFVAHEGGTAFVVPNAYSLTWTREAQEFISGTLLCAFDQNAQNLDRLRSRLEAKRMKRILKRFGIKGQQALASFPSRDEVFARFDEVYLSSAWWYPDRFNPSPIPAKVPKSVRVYILRPAARGIEWIRATPARVRQH